MHLRRSALAVVLMATLAGCGVGGSTTQCDLAATAMTEGQLATAAELYARAQQSGEGACADSGLDSVANRYASAFREAARGTALEVAADNAGAQAAYQSALALDQGNQPAMNGLTRLGVPQEQRITSLALPAVPPYPQATVWTGWPIVLPTFLLAVAALLFALLRRSPARRTTPGSAYPDDAGSGGSRARSADSGRPVGATSRWRRANDWVAGRRKPSNEEGPPEDRGYAADTEANPDTDADGSESPLGSPVADRRAAPEPPTRPVRPVTSEDARTDPVTVVHPAPRGLDLGRSEDPRPGTAEPTVPHARAGGRRTGPPSSGDADPAEDDPEPAPPAAPGVPAAAGAAAPSATSERPAEPDPAVAAQGAEIGQLQRLLDRTVRADDRPLPRRFFASGENVPGAAVGVTLAVCDVSLTGGDQDVRRLLCVQRLVVGAIPGGDWAPAEGVEWGSSVQGDVERRSVGTIRDHDGRVWSTDPVADERGLLRLLDAARPGWTTLLRGDDAAAGPLDRPSSAGSSALQAALEGREIVVSPGPRPAGVRVIALVDALLVDGTIANARVEAQHHEMLAAAAAESIESALAGELVDLQKRGSNP